MDKLPQTIDYEKCAKGNKTICGIIELSAMPRLCELLVNSNGAANVSLHFYLNDDNLATIELKIVAKLPLVCQRCLNVMVFEINSTRHICPIIQEAQVKLLPTGFEPYVLTDDNTKALNPTDLIEEELILSIPIVPKHDGADGICKEIKLQETIDTKKPFANLKKIITNQA